MPMESVSKVRRWALVEGRGILSVARARGLSRNTIRKDPGDESPPGCQRRAPPVRRRPCDGFDLGLREVFDRDRKPSRRERRAAAWLLGPPVSEGRAGSHSPVRRFVRDLERAGARSGEAFIPLHPAAGDALRFDRSEDRVVRGGVERPEKLAHGRLCHGRKPPVAACPGEAREMVPDAFVRALSFCGGIPRRAITDNPKTMAPKRWRVVSPVPRTGCCIHGSWR